MCYDGPGSLLSRPVWFTGMNGEAPCPVRIDGNYTRPQERSRFHVETILSRHLLGAGVARRSLFQPNAHPGPNRYAYSYGNASAHCHTNARADTHAYGGSPAACFGVRNDRPPEHG